MSILQRIKWIGIDVCLATAAIALAYFMRFIPVQTGINVEEGARTYAKQAFMIAPIFILVRIVFFALFDLYRGLSRFAGLHELRQVILAVSFGTAALVSWNVICKHLFHFVHFENGVNTVVPLGVIPVDWMACLILVGGRRVARRMWSLSRVTNTVANFNNVLVIGASDMGELVVRNLQSNPKMGYRAVGFVDDDPSLHGRQIHGLEVFGGVDRMPELIRLFDVTEVIVATPRPSLPFLNSIVEVCETAHVGFKTVPSVSDVMHERVSINQLRPVEIEDLLGREQVDLRLNEDINYIRDEVVLVTGAGGSIGSELCRQILRCKPKLLILLGHGENSVYEIGLELGYNFVTNEGALVLEVADVQDVDRLEQVFDAHKPSVVFHAAAHKHVPLMEMQPQEAVKNNIIGTFNVAFLAKQHDVKRFIMISTDKAVRPTSVMGVSKRVAEMVVSALSSDSETTRYLTVRFGNVLGSRGSVVPVFRRQIAAGGPVTVMHPDIERYFMTIPEASNLVLQAGAIGDNGHLFLLDMGQPVKIVDMARRMITLSGYEPNVDIDIEFVGLRPGEKLKEELLTDNEDLAPTRNPKIFSTCVNKPELSEVKEWLRNFDDLCIGGSPKEIVDALCDIVPEYSPMRSDFVPREMVVPEPEDAAEEVIVDEVDLDVSSVIEEEELVEAVEEEPDDVPDVNNVLDGLTIAFAESEAEPEPEKSSQPMEFVEAVEEALPVEEEPVPAEEAPAPVLDVPHPSEALAALRDGFFGFPAKRLDDDDEDDKSADS